MNTTMGKLARMAGLVSIVASTFLFGGCPRVVDPVDMPPAISSFSASPSSIKEGESSMLKFTATDDNGLESVVVATGDTSASRKFDAHGQTSYTDSLSVPYAIVGTKTPSVTAYDTKGQASAAKTTQVNVGVLADPVVDIDSVDFSEGSRSAIAFSALAHSPEGNPVNVSVASLSSLITATLSDSLRVLPINEDINGTYLLRFNVTDSKTGKSVQKDVPVNIASRDVLAGFISDLAKGSFLEVRDANQVMKGPFNANSWVKINGVKYPVGSDGSFKTQKLVPAASYDIAGFITNGTDSSFVSTLTYPTGDHAGIPVRVPTNAGTSLYLQLFHDLIQEGNLRKGNFVTALDNKVKGIDFSKAKQYTYWIAQKDTNAFGVTYSALRPEQQDSIVNDIHNKTCYWLPDSLQPNIYKAQLNEDLPLIPGTFIPRQGIILVMQFNSTQTQGEGEAHDFNDDGIVESYILRLKSPFKVDFVEAGRISVTNDIFNTNLYNKSAFYVTAPFNQYMNGDPKLFWVPVFDKPGSDGTKRYSMPN